MTEPRDDELSRIYREAGSLEPSQRSDDAILAAARRAAGAGPRPVRPSLAHRWSVPVALAATVVLAATLTLDTFRERPQMDTALPPLPDEVVAPGAVAPANATSSELKQAAPALPRATVRRDETQQSVRESAPSAEHLGPGREGFASGAPRAADALRKRDGPNPAARPRAEAAAASTGSVSATAARVAAPDSGQRTPEKWLEDIRRLRSEGKTAGAGRELSEFRKRYPDYALPEDLR